MIKIDERLLNHSFVYREYIEDDTWGKPKLEEPVTVKNCRIDETDVFATVQGERRQVANAIIFCYVGQTAPFLEFKVRSKVEIYGIERTITKVVHVNEPWTDKLWAFELEVV